MLILQKQDWREQRMSSNEILKILSWIFFSLTAVGVVASVVIFFKFRILEVIQDLNGTLAQKQIQAMRERTLSENKKNFGQDILESGLDEAVAKSGRLGRTGRIGRTTSNLGATGEISSSGSGALNNQEAKESTTANGIELGSLQNQLGAVGAQNGTTLLQNNRVINENFVLVKNIVYINTSEFI